MRNSHDKSFPIGIAFGSRVFVCDNLAFMGDKSPALEILKERFARGEIDKAEFEERRQVLASA